MSSRFEGKLFQTNASSEGGRAHLAAVNAASHVRRVTSSWTTRWASSSPALAGARIKQRSQARFTLSARPRSL
jgi:hypothetical protein